MKKCKILNLLLILFLALFIAGCGKMSMNFDVNVNEKGSGEFRLKLEGEGIFAQLLANDETTKDEVNKDFFGKSKFDEVKQYAEGEKLIVDGISKFKSIEEFNKKFKTDKQDQFSFELAKSSSLFIDKYVFKVRYPNDLSFNTKDNTQQDNEFMSQEDIDNFIKNNIFINVSASMPGQIIKHNFINQQNNKVTLAQTVGQAKASQVLEVESKVLNKRNIVIAIAVGMVLIVSILSFVFIKKKRAIES